MISLDQSLARLAADGVVTREDAREKASVPTMFDQFLGHFEVERMAASTEAAKKAPGAKTGGNSAGPKTAARA